MSRITAVVMLSLLCQLAIAGPSADAPAAEQAAAAEADPTSPPAADAASGESAEPTVIVDRARDMRAPIGIGFGVMGSVGIKAIVTDDVLQVTVEMIIYYEGKAIRMESVVNYDLSSAEPVSGRAETSVDDEICMTGMIEFDQTTYSYSGVGLMDADSGEAIDPPLEFGDPEMARPDGPIMFRSDLAVMAPRLLTGDEMMMAVTIVEFPDDMEAPELVTFKSGWYLTKDAVGEDGNVTFWLLDQDPSEMTTEAAEKNRGRMPRVTYNASGEIVDYQLNDAFRLVEPAEDESAEDGQADQGQTQPEEGDE